VLGSAERKTLVNRVAKPDGDHSMFEFTMPQSGETMEEGTVVTWLKREGDPVEQGEAIVEIETDKALLEAESPYSGILRKILCPEGETVPVHTPLALIGEADEKIPQFDETGSPPGEPILSEPPKDQPSTTDASPRPRVDMQGTRIPASPAARRLAAEQGIDLESLRPGSGPGGRITFSDVGRAAPADQGPVRRPLSRMRKAIARNMTAAKSSVPHFYVRSTIDAEPLVTFFKEEKTRYPCTLNDAIVSACGRAIREFPAFGSRLDGEDLVEFPGADIGIAVGTDDGLLVPTLVGVDRMSLAQVAAESARVTELARNRKLEIRGERTFTVSNLGMYGVDEFAAIIFPPDTAILAVGVIREEPVVEDGAVTPGKRMTLTLSCDHRVIDGVLAARFLGRLKEILGNPQQLIDR
jgi:pyruvate dehydrogenase E2 component (dihydrolipoamide acetyltransferase)